MNRPARTKPRRGWIKRTLLIALAAVLVFAGLLIGGIRLLDHLAPQYRHALADRIGQRIDANVSASDLRIGLGWHGPILYLDDLCITRHGGNRAAITADRVGLQFSLPDLVSGARVPDGLIVDGVHAALVQTGDGLRLAHWGPTGTAGADWSKLEAVRGQIDHLRIRGGQLAIISTNVPGGRMQWSNLRVTANDRDSQTLQVTASADGPDWWPTLAASATIDGPLRRPERARFSLHGQNIDALTAAREKQSKLAPGLHGGRLSFDVNGHWRRDRLADTRIRVTSKALKMQGESRPIVPALRAVFDLASDPGANRIDLELARLTGGPESFDALDVEAHFDGSSRALTLAARHLPGALAIRLARIAEPRLTDADIHGSIDHLTLDWQPGRPLATALGFHDLTVEDPKIAFGPIAGRYTQQGDQHTLRFDAADGKLSAARYIKGVVDITDLGGRVRWRPNTAGGWSIDLDKLRLASGKAYLTTSGRVRLPDRGAPIVDLTADAAAPHAARLLQHIPEADDLPNPRLRDWLGRAILAGSLDRGHVEVKGPMNRFPFVDGRNDTGFHMTLSGHGVAVRYKPQWPELTDARGTLSLDGDTLAFELARATMLGVTIDSAKAHVDDVREPVMHLTGRVGDAPARKLMSFLSQSPLRERFSELVDALDVTGPADLHLALRVPLKPALGDVKVDGRVDATGNTLRQQALPGPITDIHGQLAFSTHGVKAKKLTGQLLNMPISAALAPAPEGGERITARAQPSLPADHTALAHYLPDAWLVYGRGRAPMTVAFTVKRSGQVSPIRIDSDLAGMAIDLPAPLHKAAAAKAPLSITFDPDTKQVDADYDDHLHLTVDLNGQDQPERARVVLGDAAPDAPDENGLWIGGHADEVDGLGWFHVVRHVVYGAPADVSGSVADTTAKTTGEPESARRATDLAFLGGDLAIERLTFGDRYIEKPHIRAQTMNAAPGWRVNFEGDDSQGQITWTLPTGSRTRRIAGNLKRVALRTEPAQPAQATVAKADRSIVVWPDLAPANLPTLKLFIQNFVVDGTSFGQTHVDARGTANGWTLDRFQLAGGELTGNASAYWQQDRGISQARAHADFDGHGLSRLLRIFGQVSPIEAESARIRSDLRIKANANGLDLRYLNGDVHLALDDGTLLTVEPGASRLLGLFNLYVLPRRLGLDFRDVVDQGMAFDKIRADFDIQRGQAYSDNARIVTPSAIIGITGRIGLARRDYDEHVTIAPKMGSGVVLASTVLGGPIVGAAVFAVQELLKKPIRYFSSVEYNLKGSWDDPRIVDARANNGAGKNRPSDTGSTHTAPANR